MNCRKESVMRFVRRILVLTVFVPLVAHADHVDFFGISWRVAGDR
jgi:hypothetical protein